MFPEHKSARETKIQWKKIITKHCNDWKMTSLYNYTMYSKSYKIRGQDVDIVLKQYSEEDSHFEYELHIVDIDYPDDIKYKCSNYGTIYDIEELVFNNLKKCIELQINSASNKKNLVKLLKNNNYELNSKKHGYLKVIDNYEIWYQINNPDNIKVFIGLPKITPYNYIIRHEINFEKLTEQIILDNEKLTKEFAKLVS